MSTATLIIGPEHDGQRMTLAEFEDAEGREGYVYELGRGIVVVNKIPRPSHFLLVNAVRRQLAIYEARTDSAELILGTGGDCKILLEELESERHPDLAIYLNPIPTDADDSAAWARWIPEIVIEIVSPGSKHRDYGEKPEEYLRFGVKEYWIVDAKQQLVTVLERSRGRWTERQLKPPAKHTTHLLPGFELDVAAVFAAAKGA